MRRKVPRRPPLKAIVLCLCSSIMIALTVHDKTMAEIDHNFLLEHHVRKLMTNCGVELTVNSSCPRVLAGTPTAAAGLGHRITEVVFFAQLSRLYNAALVLRPFDESLSQHHDSHSFSVQLLGIGALFRNNMLNDLDLSQHEFSNQSSQDCNVRLVGDYLSCPGGNCFQSPLLRNAFQNFAPCLRELSLQAGTWHKMQPYRKYDIPKFKIFWHIRVGDVMPYPPESNFYENLYKSLSKLISSVVKDKRVKYFIAADWETITDLQRNAFLERFQSLLQLERFEILDSDLKQVLMSMLHADLLIGTGSSLSSIVPLFSTRPIYVNVVPKHGWNFQAESFTAALETLETGEIVTPVMEFQRLYDERQKFRDKTKCSSHSSSKSS